MAKARTGMDMPQIGEWAFIIGVLLAVVLGLFPNTILDTATTALVLVILGVIVGLLNITVRETTAFLLATLALLAAGNAFTSLAVFGLGGYLTDVLANVAVLVAPAAVIVALKAIFELARRS